MLADVTFPPMASEGLILVRAAIHLRGLRVGQTVLVDPTDPYIADCLKAEFLVAVEDER